MIRSASSFLAEVFVAPSMLCKLSVYDWAWLHMYLSSVYLMYMGGFLRVTKMMSSATKIEPQDSFRHLHMLLLCLERSHLSICLEY